MTLILVPLDHSACSIDAFRYALDLAERLDAEVEALHVYRPPNGMFGFFPPTAITKRQGANRAATERARARAQQELDALVERETTARNASAEAVVESGEPTTEILSRAGSGRYDLIVMGTHGRTGFAHWLLGSVAENVVRLSPCPVLTIRPTSPPESPKPRAETTAGTQV